MSSDLVSTSAEPLAMLSDLAASIPVSAEDRAEVQARVASMMEDLRGVDIYAGEKSINDSFNDTFRRAKALRDETQDVSSSFTQTNFKSLGNGSSEPLRVVNQLAEALQGLDPNLAGLGAKGDKVLGLLPIPGLAKRRIANYARKFQSSEEAVGKLMEGVIEASDSGTRDHAELESYERKLLRLARSLRIQHEAYGEIERGLLEYTKGEQSKGEGADLIKINQVNNQLMVKVKQETLSNIEILNATMLGITEIGALKKTQLQVTNACDRVATTGRIMLSINQTVAFAIHKQAQTAEAVTKVSAIINESTRSNAKLTREHVAKMQEIEKNPLASVQAYQDAYKEVFAATALFREYDQKAVGELDRSINAMAQLAGKAQALVDLNAEKAKTFQAVTSQVASKLAAPSQEIAIEPAPISAAASGLRERLAVARDQEPEAEPNPRQTRSVGPR